MLTVQPHSHMHLFVTKPPPKTLRRFQAYVDASGGATRAASLLGCTRQAAEYLYLGTRSPGMQLAARIEKLAGIPMRDWIDVKTETVKRIA